MKIVAASDLHLEFSQADWSQALAFPTDTDVIVLAGDIGVGNLSTEIVLDLSDKYPRSHIVWVAGNHEFYNHNIDSQIEKYRSACSKNDRVHFLENSSVEIHSVRFLGCTLWTDFSILSDSERSMHIADRGVNDFSLIRTRDEDRFRPQDSAEFFKISSTYLEAELSISNSNKTVVVSHFPPGLKTHNKKYSLDGLAAYFQANVDHIINQYQPSLWIYGHNHCSDDFRIGNTRLVSNQLGYPSEQGHIPTYDASKTIHL